jgi:hypothetical protein
MSVETRGPLGGGNATSTDSPKRSVRDLVPVSPSSFALFRFHAFTRGGLARYASGGRASISASSSAVNV